MRPSKKETTTAISRAELLEASARGNAYLARPFHEISRELLVKANELIVKRRNAICEIAKDDAKNAG